MIFVFEMMVFCRWKCVEENSLGFSLLWVKGGVFLLIFVIRVRSVNGGKSFLVRIKLDVIMTMKFRFSLLVMFLVVSFFSCKNEPEEKLPATVKVVFKTTWQGQDFALEQVYLDAFNNRVRIDKFSSYYSWLTLVKDDGSELRLRDFMLLNHSGDNALEFVVPDGNYTKLRFGVGIPRDYNKDQDPAQYPSSSPLSVAGSAGMFWSWNTGYIFSKIEGKCDTTGTDGVALLSPVAIHAGDDSSYRDVASSEFNMKMEAGVLKEIVIDIRMDFIFGFGNDNGIDIAQEAITHTSTNPELAQKFMDNFVEAIVISQ
jgi:hypothetical protein